MKPDLLPAKSLDSDDLAAAKSAWLHSLGYEVKFLVKGDGKGRWVEIYAVPKLPKGG